MALDDIRSSVETARNAITTAQGAAEAAMEHAQELAPRRGRAGGKASRTP